MAAYLSHWTGTSLRSYSFTTCSSMIKLCTSIFSRPLLTWLPDLIKRAVPFQPPEKPGGLTRALEVGNSRMVTVASENCTRIHSGCFVLAIQGYRYEIACNMLHFTLQVSKLHLQMLKVIAHSVNLIILQKIINLGTNQVSDYLLFEQHIYR